MIQKNLISSFLVRNYDEAVQFYTEKLGFVVVEDLPMGGDDRWRMCFRHPPGKERN
jgi:catechol 2,3-dioxygenase-like lactoylglutathione lyase family enzyme